MVWILLPPQQSHIHSFILGGVVDQMTRTKTYKNNLTPPFLPFGTCCSCCTNREHAGPSAAFKRSLQELSDDTRSTLFACFRQYTVFLVKMMPRSETLFNEICKGNFLKYGERVIMLHILIIYKDNNI